MAASSAPSFGETAEALFLTSGFVYDDAEQAEATFNGEVEHYQYSRFGNPTVAMLEDRLARSRARRRAAPPRPAWRRCTRRCFASARRRPGGGVAGAVRLLPLDRLHPAAALRHRSEFVDGADLAQWRAALAAAGRAGAAGNAVQSDAGDGRSARGGELAHAAGAIVVVDNVFATPLLQKPLQFGADVVVYSCTKHIDGQGRVLGGAVLGRQKWIEETLQPFVRNTGPAMSPFNAWLLLKGLETLALRVDAACRSAAAIADFLAAQPAIARVWYPTRADHPQRALAMRAGERRRHHGDVRGGRAARTAAFRLMNALRLVGCPTTWAIPSRWSPTRRPPRICGSAPRSRRGWASPTG